MAFEWLGQNWLDLLQVLGLFAAAIEIRNSTKARRLSNLFTLTNSHREIWKTVLHDPNLDRILAPDRALDKEPLSFQEEEYINLIILHVKTSFEALSAGLPLDRKGVAADIRALFLLPAISFMWEKVKPFHDRRFVQSVDAWLA